MPWLRFIQDFDFHPRPNVIVAYRRGTVVFVNTPCATEALAKGKAEKTERPDASRRS